MKINTKKFKKMTSMFLTMVFVFTSIFTSFSSLAKKVSAESEKIDWKNEDQWYIYDHYDSNYKGSVSDTFSKPYYEFTDHNTYYTELEGDNGIRKNVLEQKGTYETDNDKINIPNTARFAKHIYVTGEGPNTKLSFLGYGFVNQENYADFMINKMAGKGTKTVKFDIDMTNVNTHTFVGTGIMFNTKVDETNGSVDGYILYVQPEIRLKDNGVPYSDSVKKGHLRLIDIKKDLGADITLDKLHQQMRWVDKNGPNPMLMNAGVKIKDTEWEVSSTGKRAIRVTMVIQDKSLDITQQVAQGDNWSKRVSSSVSFDEKDGGNFGPIVQFSGISHNCEKLSYVEMSNLVFSEGYSVAFDLNDRDGGVTADWRDTNIPDQIATGITKGQTMEEAKAWPEKPYREGYNFVGWNDQETGDGTYFYPTTKIEKVETLYAIWRKEGATFNFDTENKGTITNKLDEEVDKYTEYHELEPGKETGEVKKLPIFNLSKDLLNTKFKAWKNIETENEYYIDEKGDIIRVVDKNGNELDRKNIEFRNEEEYNFVPIIMEDKNGDGIPDNEQALYSLKFVEDNDTKGMISGDNPGYWIAGDENTSPSEPLDLKNNLDKITISKDKQKTEIYDKVDIIAPDVAKGPKFKTHVWVYNGVEYTDKEIKDLKGLDTVDKDIVYTLKYVDDSNGDGIPDSKQALYKVIFEADPAEGTLTGNTAYYVAGEEGTQNGEELDVTTAKVSLVGDEYTPGVKLVVPTVNANANFTFKNLWNNGTEDKDKEYIETLKLQDNANFKAVFKGDKNGDDIPDDEQAIYGVTFVDGNAGTIKGHNPGYYVAGKQGTKNGDTLEKTDVKISEKDVPGVWKNDIVPPTVDDIEFKVPLWVYEGKDYTSDEVKEWAEFSKDMVFTLKYVEDVNGDGIPDSRQALYSVEFASSDLNKGDVKADIANGSALKYWVAGPLGSKNGDILNIGSQDVKLSRDGDKASTDAIPAFIAPDVEVKSKEYIFLGLWNGPNKKYDNDEITKLKEISSNIKFLALYDGDSNKDGIPDSDQAIYTVEFKVKNPNMGGFDSGVVTKFIVAGAKGTKQGEIVQINKAASIKNALDIEKGELLFEVPEVKAIGNAKFSGEWNDGKATHTPSQVEALELTGNVVLTAEMKPETGAIEFVGFGKIYPFAGTVTIGQTLGEMICTDNAIDANGNASDTFKNLRTKLLRPRYKITGWLINGIGSVYTNEQLLNYRVVGPTKFVAIYSLGVEK